MPIYMNRNPRGSLVTRTNECTNPSFETGTAGWQYSWFGQGPGAGTNTRATGQSWAAAGNSMIQKLWSASPSDNSDSGFQYVMPWAPGIVKTISGRMVTPQNSHRAWLRTYFYDASGNQLVQNNGPIVTMAQNTWWTLSMTTSAPPGSDHALIWFSLAGADTPMRPGESLYLDSVLIETTETVGSYFDGSVGNNIVWGDFCTWTGTAHGSTTNYSIPDPSAAVSPIMVNGFDDQIVQPSIVHQLLSGASAVTQRNPGMRAGTMRMLFATRADAYQARQGFARAGVWYFYDSDTLPETKMSFVVTGQLHVTQSDSRQTWLLDVPFQEVPT